MAGERVQLTTPALPGGNPGWSPDGTQIAFAARQRGEPRRVYVETAAGGGLRKLTNGESGGSMVLSMVHVLRRISIR